MLPNSVLQSIGPGRARDGAALIISLFTRYSNSRNYLLYVLQGPRHSEDATVQSHGREYCMSFRANRWWQLKEILLQLTIAAVENSAHRAFTRDSPPRFIVY
jgi:hypothetical protein